VGKIYIEKVDVSEFVKGRPRDWLEAVQRTQLRGPELLLWPRG
jgi:hypothetical protein